MGPDVFLSRLEQEEGKVYISRIKDIFTGWFEGLKISDESRVDTKTLARLNQKIDDLRCAVQLLIIFIMLIVVVLVAQTLDSPYSPFYGRGWSFFILLFTIVFLPAIVFILRAHDN